MCVVGGLKEERCHGILISLLKYHKGKHIFFGGAVKHAIEGKVEWQLFLTIDNFLPEIHFSQVLDYTSDPVIFLL